MILEVAAGTSTVDVDALQAALTRGTARPTVAEQAAVTASDAVVCSPHVFLPDGTDIPNPGLDVEWVGDYPLIEADDPTVYEKILTSSALP